MRAACAETSGAPHIADERSTGHQHRTATMYAVLGASTAVGRELVGKLLQRGLPVRVMVRKAADAQHFAKLGAQVVQADLRDLAGVSGAVHGTETLISLIGRHFADTEKEFWKTEVEGTRTIVQAAQQARVNHVVMLSVLWA